MNKSHAKKQLALFQCDYNRSIEELFAQTLSENEHIRLFFINENRAFTDGTNIIVDPGADMLFADTIALQNTEARLGLPAVISTDTWYALRMITRAQNIHETLHIIYTTFPSPVIADKRSSTTARTKTLALIANIIEDAFIEAAGCSVFDNLELYLGFGRLSRLYANMPSAGTVEQVFSATSPDNEQSIPDTYSPLTRYLDCMITFLLYPMLEEEPPPSDIAEYVEQTKQLFVDGSLCGNPDERYGFSQKIFDIIEPLIPESDLPIDIGKLEMYLGGLKTHDLNHSTINSFTRKGKTCTVSRRLFVDGNGHRIASNHAKQLLFVIKQFDTDKSAALNIISYCGSKTEFSGKDYDCSKLHTNIKIIETKPAVNLNLKKAYQNICNKYQLNINSYNSRFTHMLKTRTEIRQEKELFGAGINSKRLGDVRKRFWYKNAPEYEIPDIAIMLLIDGSGSMRGERCDNAIISSVILHEVLRKQKIAHCIVEHRANFGELSIDINILVDFNAPVEQRYNILQIYSNDENRDAPALFWAEKYIAQHTLSDDKLIIVISDGLPSHHADNYLPPISTQDTANAAAKIIKRGTNIIAIALDDEDSFDCYENLKYIYPNTISCNDLKRLPGQLLALISRQFDKG